MPGGLVLGRPADALSRAGRRPAPRPLAGYTLPVSSSRFRALSYLAYRALLAQPLKRLAQTGSGLERFLASYGSEGLVPTGPGDRAAGEAASACIACGLCEVDCPLASDIPTARALGLHAAFRLYGKSTLELPYALDALSACSACGACASSCPTGVPIPAVVAHLLARAAELRGVPGGAPAEPEALPP